MKALNNDKSVTYVIYNPKTGTRYGRKEWSSEAQAKSYLTRRKNHHYEWFLHDLNDTVNYINDLYNSGRFTEEVNGPNKYATQEGIDAHREEMKEYNSDWKRYKQLCNSEVVTYDYFYENEPMVERTNKVCGTKFMERKNTPGYLSPASDAYYT